MKVADSKFIFYLSFYFATYGIVYSETNGKVVFEGFYLIFQHKMDCGAVKPLTLPKHHLAGAEIQVCGTQTDPLRTTRTRSRLGVWPYL